ncbi:bridging integrator 3 [Patella vulgata]|uniref:bridging integrator 3 n=1 Tax=Patella vulgata TaxID=6465 RepID=UPI00217F663D|nr:bridging integrator 3 [Patella vulgata]
MSWNPFRSSPKKSVITRTEEREFDKEVKKLEELDQVTKKLYKDVKRSTEAKQVAAKSERKITQDLLNSTLCQTDEELKQQVEDWDRSVNKLEVYTHDMSNCVQKTVIEPMKKFSSIFPGVQTAVKKRDQALQEYQKCQMKVDKYELRDRTGINRVKQESAKKSLHAAREEFMYRNTALKEDMPKLRNGRIEYIQPSFESLINSQTTYNTEAFKIYSESYFQMNGLMETTKEEYKDRIQKNLSSIKSLSITVDD